jgi:hypothetical protein
MIIQKEINMADKGDLTHQAISSYFIGPEAENLDEFKANIATILDELEKTRKAYFPQPPVRSLPPKTTQKATVVLTPSPPTPGQKIHPTRSEKL